MQQALLWSQLTGQDGRKVGYDSKFFYIRLFRATINFMEYCKNGNHLDDFRKCEHFAINILNEQQEQTSNHFARSAADKFNSIDQVEDVLGIQVLSDALATLVCKNYQWVEAGDHYIILGQIEHCSINSGKPLLFHNGKYHQANLHPVHLEQCA